MASIGSSFPAYSKLRPPIIAASSAVRGTSASSSMDSLVGVGSFAHRAHSIQCWYSQGRGEIPVRTPTRRCFLQGKTQSGGESCCLAEKFYGPPGAFHRRTIQPTRDLQAALAIHRAQRAEAAVDPRPIDRARDAHVELRPRLGGHNVRARAAADDPGIHRDPPIEIGKPAGALDLPSQLQHGTVAAGKINPTVRRHTLHVNAVTGDSLSRGLVGACQSLCRFQHKHRAASGRE